MEVPTENKLMTQILLCDRQSTIIDHGCHTGKYKQTEPVVSSSKALMNSRLHFSNNMAHLEKRSSFDVL